MKNPIIAAVLALSLAAGSVHADGGGSSGGSSYEAKSLPEGIASLVENGDYEGAITELDAFIIDESRNPDAWNLLGYSQRQLGMYDESMRSYKKALKLDKKHLGALEYQGELYLKLDKVRKAEKNLKKLAKYCGDCEQHAKLKSAIEAHQASS